MSRVEKSKQEKFSQVVEHATLYEVFNIKKLKRLPYLLDDKEENARKQIDQLLGLLKPIPNKDPKKFGRLKVSYEEDSRLQSCRLFATSKFSYQGMWRQVRHTLASGLYFDVDIVNCGATILYHMVQFGKVKMYQEVEREGDAENITRKIPKFLVGSMLEDYVKNRDTWLEEIQEKHGITRDQAKKLIQSILLLGSYKIPRKEEAEIYYSPRQDERYEKLVELGKETKSIGEWLCDKHNQDFIDTRIIMREKIKTDAKLKRTKPKRLEPAMLSYEIRAYEREITDNLKRYFEACGLEVGTMTFDGMMIRKIKPSDGSSLKKEELLGIMNSWMKKFSAEGSDYVGWDEIKIIIKEMDEKVELLPKDRIKLFDYSPCAGKPDEAAERLIEMVGKENFIYCDGDDGDGMLLVFDKKRGIFYRVDNKKPDSMGYVVISDYAREYAQNLWMPSKNGCQEDNYSESEHIAKLIKPLSKSLSIRDVQWMERMQDSSIGKLFYNNGFYDMDTGIFEPSFSPEIYSRHRINHNFVPRTKENGRYINKCIRYAMSITFDRFFSSPEEAQPLISSLAHALYGKNKLQQYVFCPGVTGSGKSKFITMLKNAFGDYVGSFDIENLKVDNSTNDKAKKLGWAYYSKFERILISSEKPDNVKLDCGLMKMLTGGDAITARAMFQVLSKTNKFVPHFTPFSFVNAMPEINMDEALERRLKVKRFKRRIQSKEDYENDNENVNNYVPYDPKIDEKINSEEFFVGFTHIFLDSYLKKETPKFSKEDMLYCITGSSTDAVELIDNIFVFKNHSEKDVCRITKAELTKVFDENKANLNGMGIAEFKDKIVNIAQVHGITVNMNEKPVRIGKSTVRCIHNMRLKRQSEKDADETITSGYDRTGEKNKKEDFQNATINLYPKKYSDEDEEEEMSEVQKANEMTSNALKYAQNGNLEKATKMLREFHKRRNYFEKA